MPVTGIGVVGAGVMADVFARRIGELDGVAVRAVCPAQGEDTRELAARHGVPAVRATVAELVADPAVDAVYVASVPSLHLEHALTALEAGRHVLVEKPLAVTADQAERMAAAARRAGRLLMELYPAPFEPNIAAVRDALPSLPRLRRAVLVKEQYSSAYDAFLAGQDPAAFDPARGGGSILDLGFYPVSLAVHLFGVPERVVATGQLLDNGADALGTILLGYDGLQVDCVHGKVAASGIESQISGEGGVLLLDDIATPRRVRRLDLGPDRRLAPGADLTRERTGSHLAYGVDAFVSLLRDGSLDSPVHPVAHAVEALRVLDEARRQVGVRYRADR